MTAYYVSVLFIDHFSLTHSTAIVVLQGATVGDLKKAIQRYVSRKHIKEGGTSFVSW